MLAAHNEEANIERRLAEFGDLLNIASATGEVLVVSDGSTDRTTALARAAGGSVRVLEIAEGVGKAAALTTGCQSCVSDVLVFADARQRWAPDALQRLLENFADPKIGAVSGDLQLEAAPGVMAGIGIYWHFEKWLRQMESQIHSQVGVTGAISAVRRPLFRAIPPGTLLDDVYWPLQVAMQGYRVVHDARALLSIACLRIRGMSFAARCGRWRATFNWPLDCRRRCCLGAIRCGCSGSRINCCAW